MQTEGIGDIVDLAGALCFDLRRGEIWPEVNYIYVSWSVAGSGLNY